MSKNNVFVDIHVLQTVPPSCINRDDTGSPKTARYGGVTRARVSSQSWKRAVRLDFEGQLDKELLGKRTKFLRELIVQELQTEGAEESQEKLEKKVDNALNGIGLKADSKSAEKLSVLFFISAGQVKALAEVIQNLKGSAPTKEEKEALQTALKQMPSADLALFGRMVASDPSLNYDASAQVSHAISTHAVQNEFDYFTAVDDNRPEDNAGAGHVGTVEYNSATLYRYATVNIRELAEYLEGNTAQIVRCFAEAFVRTMPTGKQNTFANRTMPDNVYITLRHDQPVNLVGAFEKPVPPSANGYVEESRKRLADYAKRVYEDFSAEPALALAAGEGLDALAEKLPLGELLDRLEAAVSAEVSK